MTHEIRKQFRFEAAHTLPGRPVDADPSRRIHGHSYRAEVAVRGTPDPASGMVLDFGLFERALHFVRDQLDHRLLDDVPGLGPATMENLARFVWDEVTPRCPGVSCVTIHRDSTGEACLYFGPERAAPAQ